MSNIKKVKVGNKTVDWDTALGGPVVAFPDALQPKPKPKEKPKTD